MFAPQARQKSGHPPPLPATEPQRGERHTPPTILAKLPSRALTFAPHALHPRLAGPRR